MIVIVAGEQDVTAKWVTDALVRAGRGDIFWVDLEKAHENLLITWSAGEEGVSWMLRSRNNPEKVLIPKNITAIWWRRIVSRLDSPMMGLPTSTNLDQYEIFWSLRWLLESLPHDKFPLGHPSAHSRGENKHLQMQAALKAGFIIPESFHANDIAALRGFISTQQNIALKAIRMPGVLRPGSTEEGRHIACTSFTQAFLLEKLKSVERTQLFCQQAVQRAKDLRIMVFPKETIAVEIDTSTLPDNKLDWREHSLTVAHQVVPIDPAFDRQLRHYLEIMNLTAGFFDFAAPEVGPPVFFECNTNAQWGWIEHLTGHPISEAVALELMS